MTVTAAPPAQESTSRRAVGAHGRHFRPDIQGLRAVAVLLVVLYHAGVPGLGGGYVGVDVFFVISGFLITAQLTRQVAERGLVLFRDFYLGRVRRLLPPAALVVVVTLLVSSYCAPPLETKALGLDAVFIAFYGLNYRLAVQGINYQNAGASASALQHFWSLAVEEQYYVLWPLVICAVVVLARRRWRAVLLLVLVIVIAGSLYESQRLLTDNAPMSYFSLQSRAWELGLGGLLALGTGVLARLPRAVRASASYVGIALIAVGGVVYTSRTPFPGVHALVPVAGAALVIGAGCGGPVGPERWLERRPVQGLGKVSYPLYLWHWPLLILAPAMAPSYRFTWVSNLELMVVALWLAVLTQYLVDAPLRKLSLQKTSWASAGLSTSLVVLCFGAVTSASALPSADTGGRPLPIARAALIGDPLALGPTSGPVAPPVGSAVSDTPHYPAACIVGFLATSSPPCVIDKDGKLVGQRPGRDRVVLLGDSHAGEWYPDVYGIAHEEGWDTEVLNKEGCPLADITVTNPTLNRTYTECDQWRTNTVARLLREAPPKIVFIASLNYYTSDIAELSGGWQSTIDQLRRLRVPIVYLHDTPYPDEDVPVCVSGALHDWAKCDFAKYIAFHPDPLMTGSPESHGLAARVDIDQYLCPPTAAECPAVRSGVLLYRDDSHVTNTAMSLFVRDVRSQLVKAGVIQGGTS